jgi:phosphoserine phosphatase RsbU/P
MVVNADARTLEVANAGHHPVHLLRDKTDLEVSTSASGPPLGVFPDHSFITEAVELKSGDSLLLFTDGVTEPHNAQQEEFGVARIIDLSRIHGHTPAALIDAVERAIAEFSDHSPMFDDFTVVALRAE